MSHVPDQARFYELQGSLSTTPEEGDDREEREELERGTRDLEAVPEPAPDAAEAGEPTAGPRARLRPRLPMWVRFGLIGVAVLLLAVGIAGLFLPGLQGILTLLLALAVLSLVSRTMHRLLRWSLGPWPSLRKRVERHRRKSHNWIHGRVDRFEAWRRDRRRRRWERRHGRPPSRPEETGDSPERL